MASLRLYFEAIIQDPIEKIREKISSDESIFAKFESSSILTPGLYKKSKVLSPILDDYYISDFFEIGQKKLPTLITELSYFNYDNKTKSEIRQFPILIKILYNQKKRVLGFYSRSPLKNKLADNLIIKLKQKYHFNFRFDPLLYIYQEENLDKFVRVLNIKDFTAITIWDRDNKITLKNPRKISETKKYIDFFNEQSSGNWTHLKVPFDDLDIELKIHRQTQRFITFENDYIDDIHLTKAADFLANKILEFEDFKQKKQTFLDSYDWAKDQ